MDGNNSNFTLLNGVSSDHSQKWVFTKWIANILKPKYNVKPMSQALSQGLEDMYANRSYYEKTSPQAELDRCKTAMREYDLMPSCFKVL